MKRSILLTLLTFALVLCTVGLTACNNGEHTHAYTNVVTPPTCMEKGYTTYACSCGESYVGDYTDKTTHTFVDGRCKDCEKRKPTEGLEYALSNDGTYYIVTGLGTATATDVSIADEIQDLPVKGIGEFAFESTSITSITIPESITTIGDEAFDGCYSLTDVYISDISAWCNIKFSKGSWGGSNPFLGSGYQGIYSATMHLNNKLVTDLVIPDDVTNINDFAFAGCISIKSVTISDSVQSIGAYSFGECDSLQSVVISDSVESIGQEAFAYCYSLQNVTIGNSVKSIGEEAFRYCFSLTSVSLGESVENIGDYAFTACHKLVEIINYSDLNIVKGSEDFGRVGLYAKQIITDSAQSKIIYNGDYIFYNDNGSYYLLGYKGMATELVLPDKINGNNYGIYPSAFNDWQLLKSVTIPDSIQRIGVNTFYYCRSLTIFIFNGSKEQWNKIEKETGWDEETGNYTIYCTDGEIPKE